MGGPVASDLVPELSRRPERIATRLTHVSALFHVPNHSSVQGMFHCGSRISPQ
jgi:hypothetical protein